MNKQVEVLKEDGSKMLPTFHKRARQLVKTGRAKWVGDNAICLLKEEIRMDINSNDRKENPVDEFNKAGYVVVDEADDDKLYKMAKKRVQERSALITHAIAYFAVLTFLSAFPGADNWIMYVAGGWGIGLACHTAQYFFQATPQAVHKEYMKQKKKFYRM